MKNKTRVRYNSVISFSKKIGHRWTPPFTSSPRPWWCGIRIWSSPADRCRPGFRATTPATRRPRLGTGRPWNRGSSSREILRTWKKVVSISLLQIIQHQMFAKCICHIEKRVGYGQLELSSWQSKCNRLYPGPSATCKLMEPYWHMRFGGLMF